MKMPRSQSETENVQFVQELAEVDGPFEAPININFRDLTKLELPSLAWNRGDACPKKMKITNTGHTVIVSGKWKCERPYLTGGPLLGKYVFSQIHFHWGQDECKGSEHQVCGEGFPLEMHVAHFKTEYMTQECALREKDGMVVVVYLFKLQDEPNHSLKKIINSLPNVKQPSTSHPIDPRPILSLCNPFTDDYFMYWGSVVTSTCAHILLWIICREPFGISREQVSEFRKIMDLSQQPICRNSRDIQPLHKRNVFHVNASKHLDDPLLPIKKILGCYCKRSDETINIKHSNECNCQGVLQNQEEVEENFVDCTSGNQCFNIEGMEAFHLKAGLSNSCFAKQTFVVQTATVKSVSIVVKRSESESVKNYCGLDNLKKIRSQGDNEDNNKQVKLVSQSCCFLPNKEVTQIKTLSGKSRKPFESVKAFSQIMRSLETLKNHTFKKLKEIESINQEIKEMKPFCQDTEDKKWIRKIEKMMTKQKRFTIKSSQGCLSELRKLAKECNFDKYFDPKALPEGDHVGEKDLDWLPNEEITNGDLPGYEACTKEEESPEAENLLLKDADLSKAVQFSEEAQKLIRSFFEDIKESEDIQETVKKNISLKKITSFYSKQGDINSVPSETKGYITQKMFILGNLGGRFFTEVSAEEFKINEENQEIQEIKDEEPITKEISQAIENSIDQVNENIVEAEDPGFESNAVQESKQPNLEPLIPLHRANVAILSSKNTIEETGAQEDELPKKASLSSEEKPKENLEISSDAESVTVEKTKQKPSPKKKLEKSNVKKSTSVKGKELYELASEKLLKTLEATIVLPKYRHSSSNLSTESTETQRMIIAKIRQSRKDFWEKNRHKSEIFKISSKVLQSRASCKKFEGYYIQKKNMKNKKRKSQKMENGKQKSLYGLSSTSKEENTKKTKSKWKRVAKAKFKLEIEKTSGSTTESIIENCLISPERKKLKLENKKYKTLSSKGSERKIYPNEYKNIYLTDTETRTIITNRSGSYREYESARVERENFERKDSSEFKAIENKPEDKNRKIVAKSPEKDFKPVSRTSTNKTFRASSADSKKSYTEIKKTQALPKDTLKREVLTFAKATPVQKIKSLSNLETHRAATEITQRTYLESIEDRRKSNKDTPAVRHKLENLKKLEEKHKILSLNDSSRGTSNETCKKLVEKQHGGETKCAKETKVICDLRTQNGAENKVGYIKNSKLPAKSRAQEEQNKSPTLRRTDTEKYQLLENDSQELNPSFQEPHAEYSEILHRTDSNKSHATENVKGGAADNKELQTSVFCSNLTSRAHSAETIHSLKKTCKRKSKKRPHCCKRSSRHYIRKNSSVFKKPNKADIKPLNFLNLTDEEQLKIISVNVAKYLQQKLVEENKVFESDKIGTEEKKTNIKPPREKKEETTMQIPSPVKKVEAKQEKLSTDKETPKKEEQKRRFGMLRKPKPIKLKFETKKEPPADTSPKPANNFIKLNKQMAGKYKRLKQDIKKVESNIAEKEKPEQTPEPVQKTTPETKPKIDTTKAKPKTLRKKSEQSPAPKSEKPKEKVQSRPETPSSPRVSSKKNSQEEKQIKSPKVIKKQKSSAKKTAKETTKETAQETPPATAEEKPNESVKNEAVTEKSFPPSPAIQEKPEETSCSSPIASPTSHLPTPIAENRVKQKSKHIENDAENECLDRSQPEELICDIKTKTQEEKKNEVLFKKELEYFIKLQMCLNNDISTNIENSLTYVKTKPEDSTETNPRENSPVNDSAGKKVIFVEKKDLLEISSSGSEFADDLVKHGPKRVENDDKTESNFKNKEILTVKIPKALDDTENTNSALAPKDGHEECNSESSYDCKISITLNTNSNAKEPENEPQSYDPFNCLGENSNNSQTTMCLEGSSSQSTVMKAHRKRRKENEIPAEMKQKLLEILEGEIKREAGITSGGSSANSSDVLTFKCEDSDGNNRSQSTESSCDNIEVLAQISNTMRQYLTYLKEMKQLSDKDGKDYDEP